MGLAVIGAIIAVRAEPRQRAWLLVALAGAAFLVPLAQLHDQTAWSLDKHLAYGIWFAAIVAGYGCSKIVQWFPGVGRRLAAVCCVIALTYPAVTSWELAWQTYHAWPSARSFVTAIRPAVASSPGLYYVFGQENVAQYYTPRGVDWKLWTGAITLDPGNVQPGALESYYAQLLNSKNFGVLALFYSTTFKQVSIPASMLLPQQSGAVYQQLLALVGQNTGEPGLAPLTQALENDPDYQLVATGPYNTTSLSGTHNYSVYAIWQKKARE
jgi:hypothetical protein